jgi:hypothetical protein
MFSEEGVSFREEDIMASLAEEQAMGERQKEELSML